MTAWWERPAVLVRSEDHCIWDTTERELESEEWWTERNTATEGLQLPETKMGGGGCGRAGGGHTCWPGACDFYRKSWLHSCTEKVWWGVRMDTETSQSPCGRKERAGPCGHLDGCAGDGGESGQVN